MSAFGTKTKKVVTYGKKKMRIINIHSDFSPSKDRETSPATPHRREPPTTPLKPKATNNETPLKPRDNNTSTPLKEKKTEKGAKKDVPLKQHAAQNRRAVYRNSPERAHIVRKPAPRRIHALRAMDRVEVTIETRSPSPKQSEPQVEPKTRAKPQEKAESGNEAKPKPKATAKRKTDDEGEPMPKSGPSKQSEAVDEVTQQVVDLTLSEDEQPVKRGPAPRKPRKAPKIIKPVQRADPTPLPSPEPEVRPDLPDESLSRLLAQCTVSQPVAFSDVFKHPAFSTLVTGFELKKQGEASYSEVFRVGDAVVKVIPLLGTDRPTDDGEDIPDCSSADDVAREIEVTRRMAQVPGGGFVGFRGAFVVTGSYPAPLLAEWDAWKAERGTESPRPIFPPEQQFALVVLDDGGGDLESAHFDSHSWTTMAAVFWQVCDALARAEKWTQFEHRDLHEGQILLQLSSPPPPTSKPTNTNYLAPSGVTATMIDFGLSRLSIDGEVRWTPLPEEVYDGVGAQWDVYRAMRDVIESQPPPAEPEPVRPPSPVPLARRRSRRTTTRVVQYVLSDSEDDDDEPSYVPPISPPSSPLASPSSSRTSTPPTSTSSLSPPTPWTAFVPASNVLWLRYLCTYLLKAARKPYARKSTSAAKEAARQRQEAAWSMLCDVGAALDPEMGMFDSAADVRSWGEECGWVA